MRVLLIDFNPFMPPVTPISLGNIGANLKFHGHEVEVVSLGSNSSFSPHGLVSYLKEYSPHLIGFGTYQRNIPHVRSIAQLAKNVLPNCRVVLGGPQATFLPDAALAALKATHSAEARAVREEGTRERSWSEVHPTAA